MSCSSLRGVAFLPSTSHRLLRAFVVSALLAALVAAGCGEPEAPPPEPIRPVRAIRVPDPAETANREFTGRARAVRRSELSFEVAGRILERPVDVGDVVREGDLLAKIDPRDFENALRAARAGLKQAKAYYDRIAEAHKLNAVSDQELTDAETAFRAARAEARLRAKDLEDTRIVAPHDGEITAAYVERFQVVAAQQPVLRLLDSSRIEMVVDVPENLIALVPYVVEAEVRFDAYPDRWISARVIEVGNEASTTTRTYPVTVALEPPSDIQIEPGMTGRSRAKVRLPEGQVSTPLYIPNSAVLEGDAGAAFVWVLAPDTGATSRRTVTLGERAPQGIEITKGVVPGEWVAVAGVRTLEEGQIVEILDIGANEWRLPMPSERTVSVGDATVSSLDN